MKSSGLAADYLRKIRNIGIIAHIDAGKTTLTERILYYTRKIHRMGEVHEGTATMDFMPEEQERGITIASACTSCLWQDKTVNIIDTPGHVDFTIEVDRALRVLDGVVAVFCAVGGVEPQSETVWRQSAKYHIPKIAFINKMDRPGADFREVLQAMRSRLGAFPLPVHVPLGQGEDFQGILDVVSGSKLVFDQDSSGRDIVVSRPDKAEAPLLDEWRNSLLESLSEIDDQIMEDYLENREIPPEKIRAALRRATLDLKGVPVLSGSALKNIGIQPVMDAVCHYLPSPEDVPQASGVHPQTKDRVSFAPAVKAPLSALVFKVSLETGRKLCFLRLYSGRLEAGQTVFNSTQTLSERLARIFTLHANHKEKVDQAVAGQIVAVAGLKNARTGDTLCLEKDPVLLEKISDYTPVISLALEPKNSQEEEKLIFAVEKLLQEDPTLFFERHKDTDQIILSGMGELHLDVVLQRIKREYGVEFRSGNPQVVYQESITTRARTEAEYARELGEEFHYGFVDLEVEPAPRGQGNRIIMEIDFDQWSQAWTGAVQEGIEDGLQAGELKGYPVTDIVVRVKKMAARDGADSVGFRLASFQALKQALAQAGPVLLEPIMLVEISTPSDFVGECVSLLGSKGSQIENMFDHHGQKIIKSLTPLSHMFGFSTELRSATQGRAGLTMKFDRFDAVGK
ncbi:elongation factor G [Desulfonatronovibrio hydrogenovorans]|uniref:elongation factor G n=1 Tax=Desulfonatronovibrio hydrogenovorans TaxID=53245 RepID=UPI00068D2901|nr:elongation factor G [Desulfonatronovibrio hydrogenovorans]